MQSSSTHTKINHKPCCCLVELSRASISSSSRGVDGGEVHSLLLLLGVQSWEVVHHEGHQHAGKDTCHHNVDIKHWQEMLLEQMAL